MPHVCATNFFSAIANRLFSITLSEHASGLLRFDKWLCHSRESGNPGEWAEFGDARLREHDGIGCSKINVTDY
jgi:hypothetical protein